eukprot:4920210-Amphidinium_carterae.1
MLEFFMCFLGSLLKSRTRNPKTPKQEHVTAGRVKKNARFTNFKTTAKNTTCEARNGYKNQRKSRKKASRLAGQKSCGKAPRLACHVTQALNRLRILGILSCSKDSNAASMLCSQGQCKSRWAAGECPCRFGGCMRL